jgi:PAS domain S-box-containing protein
MADARFPQQVTGPEVERLSAELTGLDESTNPFVAAVRATRMPMIISNPRLPDNPVVFVNDAFCRLTGYAREEILGRNCRFLQGDGTDPAAVSLIHEAVHALRPIEIDIRNYRKNGEAFWNRLLLAPVHDAHGTLAYFFASQVDVTLERERLAGLESHNAALTAELAGRLHAHRDREQELRFALEAGRLGSWTIDLTHEELSASTICKAHFGLGPQAPFTHADLLAAVHEADRERVVAALRHSVDTATDYDVEHRAVTPDGATRWVVMRGRPVYADDGRPLRMSGISLDVTDPKRAERIRQALVDLGGKIGELTSSPDLSFAAGEILGRTLGAARAGYGSVDASGRTVTFERDWTAPGVPSLAGALEARELGPLLDRLRQGEPVVVADVATDPRITADLFDALRAPGLRSILAVPVTERGMLVALVLLHDAVARSWHPDDLAFVREMADRIRASVVRLRAEQALAQLAVSLEQQVADRTAQLMTAEEALRQSQKMEAIGQLTGGVAHDFNNLLTVIRSSIDLMRRPDLAEERRRRYMDAISDTVNRAAKLTGQLLAFARRQALNPEPFDASARLRDLAEMLDSVTGGRVKVVTDVPAEPCLVRADVSQFETALVNMAVNARDAMDGAGVLTLGLRRVETIPPLRGHATIHGRFAAVTMTDTGSGIPPDQLARIFEPFYTTKEVGKGTGLGLSQVFGFAKQSGGDVDVASEIGCGTTFTLYLPEIDAPVAPEETVGGAASGPMPKGGGRRVLVVEDNLDVGRFSTQVLQDLGYETTWATDAEEALTRLGKDEARFDVVFSDVVMPGMSGIELGKEIQRRHPGLPVVLTSGYSHVLAQEGSHGFELLQKPYSAEGLSRVLRQAARRRSRAPA